VVRTAGKAVAAALALGALLVGLPAVLVASAGWPLPHSVPGWHQVEALLTGPGLPDSVLIDTLACLGWVCWTLLALSALVEIAAGLRHIPTPRLPALSPAQTLVAALVAALTLAPLLPRPGEAVSSERAPVTHSATDLDPTPSVDQQDPTGHLTLLVGDATYTCAVRPGDTLWDIAREWLGDPHRWPEIYRLNAGHRFPAVGGTLTDPDLIYPGWRLTLPDDAHPPGTGTGTGTGTGQQATPPPMPRPSAPSSGDEVTVPPPLPQPTPSAGTTTQPSPILAATPTPEAVTSTTAEGQVDAPAPAPATTTSPAPSTVDAQPPHEHRTPSQAVEVPGGWIGLPFAAAVALAATAAWQRRRRRYRTEPIPLDLPGHTAAEPDPDTDADAGADADDDDLPPLPSVVIAARQQVRRHAPALLQPRRDVTVREAAQALRTRAPLPPTAAPGPDGPSLAGLPTRLPDGALGLIGPGAHAAARALLVATLTAGRPDDTDAQGHVLITAPTLTTLLPQRQNLDDAAHPDHLRNLPGLTVTDDLPDALTRLEADLIARRRLLLDADAADLTAYRQQPDHEPVPRLLLITDTPVAALVDRVTATSELGAALGVSTVIIGFWPGDTTVTVTTDGHLDPAAVLPAPLAPAENDAPRLAVLDARATLDILATLAPNPNGNARRPVHDSATATPPAASPLPPPSAVAAATSLPAESGHRQATLPPVGDATDPPTQDSQTPDSLVTGLSGPSTAAPAHMSRVTAHVLGNPAILTADGTPVDSIREAALELLAYLAMHRDGAALDDIKEALYGDATRDRARQRLSTDVANLRGRIRHAATNGDSNGNSDTTNGDKAGDPVVNSGGRYHLNPELLDIDWWRVQDAAARAKKATTPADQVAALQEALIHYHGPLAQDRDYEWAARAREHTRRLGVAIHARLAALVGDSAPARAAQLLEAACELDPYHEDTAQLAMRAHARIGDTEAVKARLRRLRAALDELDEAPDEGTEEVAKQCVGGRQRSRPGHASRSESARGSLLAPAPPNLPFGDRSDQ
jgi:DNA-binding SARP family transcriptional activator